MSELEQELGEVLIARHLTIATAESCTGGLISNRITNISGSSNYFERGVITYSNRAKIELLNVPSVTIEQFGAVSPETATAMAVGVKELAHTDIGLGVTGIAGPTGGTPEKPVGLVYIGIFGNNKKETHEFNFKGSRIEIKNQTADAALKIILGFVNKI